MDWVERDKKVARCPAGPLIEVAVPKRQIGKEMEMQTRTHSTSPGETKAYSPWRRWISMSDRWRAASCRPEQETPAACGIPGTGNGGPDGLWAVEQGLIARKHRELGHM